jgi:hypothetical protein
LRRQAVQQLGGASSWENLCVRRIPPDDRIVQFSLPIADLERLNSWLPDIAMSLLPGAPVQASDGEIRIGRNRGLAIYSDAHWWDYEADQGGDARWS